MHILHRFVVGHEGEAAHNPYQNQGEDLETRGEISHVFAVVVVGDVSKTIDDVNVSIKLLRKFKCVCKKKKIKTITFCCRRRHLLGLHCSTF